MTIPLNGAHRSSCNGIETLTEKKLCFCAWALAAIPAKPKELFLIPMGKIHNTALDEAFLDRYTFCPDKPALSSYLKVLILKR
jgi:hypothetical protein